MTELERPYHKAGWLLPYILMIDESEYGTGRWMYWMDACQKQEVPRGPIPQVWFQQAFSSQGARDYRYTCPDEEEPDPVHHLKAVLQKAVNKGYWWKDVWMKLVFWLLWGCNQKQYEQQAMAVEPEIQEWWYTKFNWARLLQWPIDWCAPMLMTSLPGMGKPNRSKSGSGFFPTPANVVTMMAQMAYCDVEREVEKAKLLTVCDPCCGTGIMLMQAANYSFQLYGMDIDPEVVACSTLNGYLWVPWMVFWPPYMDDVFKVARKKAGMDEVPQVARLDVVDLPQAYEQLTFI